MADDPQIKIRATISADTSGADQTVAALDQIKDSAHESSGELSKLEEAGQKIGGKLQSLREANEAVRAIGEAARGGTAAVGGYAYAVRLLGESFEAFIPGGAIIVGLSTVVEITSRAIDRLQERAEKAESKNSDEEKSWRALAEAGKNYSDNLKEIIQANDLINSEESSEIDKLGKENALVLQRIDAEKELALAKAKNTYYTDLQSAKTPEEKEALKNKFEDTNAEITGNYDTQKLSAQISGKQAQVEAIQKQLADLDNQIASNAEQLHRKQDEYADAHNKINELGIQPDADGSYKDASRKPYADMLEKQQELNNAQDAFNRLPKFIKNKENTVEYSQLEEAKKALAKAESIVGAIREVTLANRDYPLAEQQYGKSTEDDLKKILEQQSKIPELQQEIEILKIKLQAQQTNNDSTTKKLQNKDKEEKERRDYELREKERLAKSNELQAQIDQNPYLPDTEKQALQTQIETIKEQGLRDKYGLSTTSIGDKDVLRSEADLDRAKLQGSIVKTTDTDAQKRFETVEKSAEGFVDTFADQQTREQLKQGIAALKDNPQAQANLLLLELARAAVEANAYQKQQLAAYQQEVKLLIANLRNGNNT